MTGSQRPDETSPGTTLLAATEICKDFGDFTANDDVVGAIPVHLIAGIWGTLAVPITNGDASFGTQITSIVIVGVFTFVVSWIVWTILKMTIGIRVSEEVELAGLDNAELGMEAYPEFSRQV